MEILLFQSRLVLWFEQWVTGRKRVKLSVKNQRKVRLLLTLVKKWLSYRLRMFSMVFIFFFFLILLNPFSPGIIEKIDICDFNNCTNFKHKTWRAIGAKSINLDIIRKLIKQPLRNTYTKAVFTSTLSILLFKGRLVVWPTDPRRESEEVKGLHFQWKTKKSSVFVEIAWKAIVLKA